MSSRHGPSDARIRMIWPSSPRMAVRALLGLRHVAPGSDLRLLTSREDGAEGELPAIGGTVPVEERAAVIRTAHASRDAIAGEGGGRGWTARPIADLDEADISLQRRIGPVWRPG